MSAFGPSDQQVACDLLASQQAAVHQALFRANIAKMTREELVAALEAARAHNEVLSQEVKELREDKVRLSLILEEEDERRANIFLRKLEELESSSAASAPNGTTTCVHCCAGGRGNSSSTRTTTTTD